MTDMTFQVGDIIDSYFWQGPGPYSADDKIHTGPYRIISRSFNDGEPHFLDQINHTKNPFIPPDNWSFVVVHASIPVGKERVTDHCYLNNYLPTMHKKIMRDVYHPCDYLIKRGSAAGTQTTLF